MQKLVKKNQNQEKKPFKVFKKTDKKFKKQKNYKLSKISKNRKLKSVKILKTILRRKACGRPFKKYKLSNKKSFLRLTIRVRPNNIFCSIKDNKANLVLKSVSAGSYKIEMSKKASRYNAKAVLNEFLKGLREQKIRFNKSLVVKIVAPVNLRSQLITMLSNSLFRKFSNKRTTIIEVDAKKSFNGCRPRKQIKKKRRGVRLFK